MKAIEEREKKEARAAARRRPWYPGSPAMLGPGLAPTNDFSFGLHYKPYPDKKLHLASSKSIATYSTSS